MLHEVIAKGKLLRGFAARVTGDELRRVEKERARPADRRDARRSSHESGLVTRHFGLPFPFRLIYNPHAIPCAYARPYTKEELTAARAESPLASAPPSLAGAL